jgi:hypothetical protein
LTNKESLEMVNTIFRDLDFIPKLYIGEAMTVNPKKGGPKKIKIHRFPAKKVTDQEIVAHMKPFYETHPWFKHPDPDIEEKIGALALHADPQTEGVDSEEPLMGLTAEDIDSSVSFRPAKADLICATLERDLFSCDSTLENSLHNNTLDNGQRRRLRSKLEEPGIQQELSVLQTQLLGVKAAKQRLGEVLLQYFQKIIDWVVAASPPSNAIPALRYSFRLLAFKYLQLPDNQRVAVFVNLMQFLVQTLLNNKNKNQR